MSDKQKYHLTVIKTDIDYIALFINLNAMRKAIITKREYVNIGSEWTESLINKLEWLKLPILRICKSQYVPDIDIEEFVNSISQTFPYQPEIGSAILANEKLPNGYMLCMMYNSTNSTNIKRMIFKKNSNFKTERPLCDRIWMFAVSDFTKYISVETLRKIYFVIIV